VARALAFVLALAALAGCARGGGREAGVLRWADAEDLDNLNPLLSTQTVVNDLSAFTMGYFFVFDDRGNPRPSLCLTVPTRENGLISADGRSLTFRLRRGVVWHDGAPFTSADVAFTVKTILDTRHEKDLNYLYGGPFAASAFYADARFIERNPKTTQAFVNAISAALDWLGKASTDEIVAAVPPEYYAADRALYRAMIESNRERVSPDGRISAEAANLTFRNLAAVEETMKNAKIDESEVGRVVAIIDSMTPQERRNYMIINGSRRRRIAKGSGTSVQDVNNLLKQYAQARKMMKSFTGQAGLLGKRLSKMKLPGLPGLPGF